MSWLLTPRVYACVGVGVRVRGVCVNVSRTNCGLRAYRFDEERQMSRASTRRGVMHTRAAVAVGRIHVGSFSQQTSDLLEICALACRS